MQEQLHVPGACGASNSISCGHRTVSVGTGYEVDCRLKAALSQGSA